MHCLTTQSCIWLSDTTRKTSHGLLSLHGDYFRWFYACVYITRIRIQLIPACMNNRTTLHNFLLHFWTDWRPNIHGAAGNNLLTLFAFSGNHCLHREFILTTYLACKHISRAILSLLTICSLPYSFIGIPINQCDYAGCSFPVLLLLMIVGHRNTHKCAQTVFSSRRSVPVRLFSTATVDPNLR